MFRQRVALITLVLQLFAACAFSARCNVSEPEENCLILWTAFQDSLVSQRTNLLRLDLMFNQPSRVTPTVVKVFYNYTINGLDECDLSCTNNCSTVLGWTSQSLYRYFHSSVINQLRFQLPFLIIKFIETNNLREEPDVEDYLWVGDSSLPELYIKLNVTVSPEDDTLNGCPSDIDILNGLGELTHSLRVFAKYALKGVNGVLEDVDPDCKGFTLPESAVKPHTHFLVSENTEDSNEVLGQKLFAYMYTLNAIIALLVGAFLLPSLFRIYDKADTSNETFFDNKIKVRFLVVTFLMSTYITLLYAIDIFLHVTIYLENINLFVLMKVLYGSITFGLVIIFIICYHCTCKDSKCYYICNCKGFVRTFLISLLTMALALLILNILPFILLLFAHPMNTFALLGIHVALFYTETMAGILIIEQLKSCTWCTFTPCIPDTPCQPCTLCTCICTSICRCIWSTCKYLYGKCTCDWCTSTSDSCTSTCTCDKCTYMYPCTCSKPSCSCTREQDLENRRTRSKCSKCSSHRCKCEDVEKPLLLSEQKNIPKTTPNEQKTYGCCKLFKLQIIRCCKILKLICCCNKIRTIYSCAIILFIGSGFVYFSVIMFYQFLFLRNLSSNNLGVDIIIKYLPSIAIGAFGFVIRKGTPSKEDKHEKYWLKLGELLNITDHGKLDNAKQEKLKKLQSIFGVSPTNYICVRQPQNPTTTATTTTTTTATTSTTATTTTTTSEPTTATATTTTATNEPTTATATNKPTATVKEKSNVV